MSDKRAWFFPSILVGALLAVLTWLGWYSQRVHHAPASATRADPAAPAVVPTQEPSPAPPTTSTPSGATSPAPAVQDASPAGPRVPPPWEKAMDQLVTGPIPTDSKERETLKTTLAKDLTGHLAEVIGYWSKHPMDYDREFYVRMAIEASLRDQDVEVAVTLFDQANFLMLCYGSTPLGKETLRRHLADTTLPGDERLFPWVERLAICGPESDVPLIMTVVGKLHSGERQQRVVRHLMRRFKNFDASTALQHLWRARPPEQFSDQQDGLVLLAAQYGVKDAFVRCGFTRYSVDLDAAQMREIMEWIEKQPALAGAIATPRWFWEHAPAFVFTDNGWKIDSNLLNSVTSSKARTPKTLPDPTPHALPAELHEHATVEAVRAWLSKKSAALQGQRWSSGISTDAIAFAGIPPSCALELLPYSKEGPDNAMLVFVHRALPSVFLQQHRDAVLEQLVKHPELLPIVLCRGWEKEAAPTVSRMLQQRDGIPSGKLVISAVEILASLQDPSYFQVLEDSLCHRYATTSRNRTVAFLECLPGFDLKSSVTKSWKTNKGSRFEPFAIPAANVGVEEALPIVVNLATQSTIMDPKRSACAFIAKTFSLPDQKPETIQRWWNEAQGRVRWDGHRWIVDAASR